MRKTMILGSILALIGYGAVAMADDQSNSSAREQIKVQRDASNDMRGERHDRSERGDRSRERHEESREEQHESREMHEESNEGNHRR